MIVQLKHLIDLVSVRPAVYRLGHTNYYGTNHATVVELSPSLLIS
jgi:hypothetical protein